MTPFPYQLIATDLDGTLVRSDHTVSPRTTAALAAAVSAGARHVVVTGRVAQWAKPTLAEIGYGGLAVCGQGGQLYDAGRDALVSSVPLDRGLAAHALSEVEALTGPLAVAVMPVELADPILVGPGYPLPPMDSAEGQRVEDVARLWDRPIGKVMIRHPHLTDDQLTEAAREAVGDLVTVVMAGPTCVEILPFGLSKATGLALAAEALGTDAQSTIAFGDMPNDIPMFAWAGHAVAMANAHDSLNAVADEITTSNDEDGVCLCFTNPSPRDG
ncbi:HAD hydrolase family protein, partial [Streptomyces sp. NPDC059411]|uniref:HAD hydrolase family protein n=1 Tax=Streptomyces sp. NPDC059411 TaxID=3346825 RepID=UPI0036B64294